LPFAFFTFVFWAVFLAFLGVARVAALVFARLAVEVLRVAFTAVFLAVFFLVFRALALCFTFFLREAVRFATALDDLTCFATPSIRHSDATAYSKSLSLKEKQN
jgi:hypothetical protein